MNYAMKKTVGFLLLTATIGLVSLQSVFHLFA